MGQFLWRAKPVREDSSDGRSRDESTVTVITMVPHPATPRNIPQQPARYPPPTRPASPPPPQQPQFPLSAQQQQQQYQPQPQLGQHKSKSKQQRTPTTRTIVGEGIHKIEASPAVTSPAKAKTVDTASDIHEPTQNFVLLTNRKSLAAGGGGGGGVGGQAKSPESEGSLLQPVDAISASKSTSGGTRRVYKVMRVAPSKFLTKKEQQAAAEAAARAAGGGGGGGAGGQSKSKGNKET